MNEPRMTRRGDLWVGEFRAMASPCEVLVRCDARQEAVELCSTAMQEALRIEHKFSRFRDDNIVHRINSSGGEAVVLDTETGRLIDFANRCYELSEGLFDISAGVLGQAWRFHEGASVPSPREVEPLLQRMGWHRADWSPPVLTLPAGMQIDLGGMGKEYAVDRCLALIGAQSPLPVLVNFGGDLHAAKPPVPNGVWRVGVSAGCRSTNSQSAPSIHLEKGAVATSGDTERFLMHEGKRYGHVLNPRTGWPVPDGPRTVTVLGSSCVEAGLLSTLALLHGREAETFLQAQGVGHWCIW